MIVDGAAVRFESGEMKGSVWAKSFSGSGNVGACCHYVLMLLRVVDHA